MLLPSPPSERVDPPLSAVDEGGATFGDRRPAFSTANAASDDGVTHTLGMASEVWYAERALQGLDHRARCEATIKRKEGAMRHARGRGGWIARGVESMRFKQHS